MVRQREEGTVAKQGPRFEVGDPILQVNLAAAVAILALGDGPPLAVVIEGHAPAHPSRRRCELMRVSMPRKVGRAEDDKAVPQW